MSFGPELYVGVILVFVLCRSAGRPAGRIADAACHLITNSKLIVLIFQAWSDPVD